MTTDKLITVYRRGEEKYCFVWDEASRNRLIVRLWSMAMDRELSFDAEDALSVAREIDEV